MPIKSTFKPYTLTSKQTKRSTYSISHFLGVNYNRDTLAISNNNASEMKNLIYRDGVIQKRNGYQQIGEIAGALNGVFKFIDEVGNTHLLFHIGTSLYETSNVGMGSLIRDYSISIIPNVVLNNSKSMGFMDKHKMYILDGSSYKVLSYTNNNWGIKPVYDDDDTFIPMTTIGITETDVALSNRKGLDDINMLTPRRKNRLEITSTLDTKKWYEFKLDSKISIDKLLFDTNHRSSTFKIEIPNMAFDYQDLSPLLEDIQYGGTATITDGTLLFAGALSSGMSYDEETETLNISYQESHYLYLVNNYTPSSQTIGETQVDEVCDNTEKFAIVNENGNYVGYLDIASGSLATIKFIGTFASTLSILKSIVVTFKGDSIAENRIMGCSFGTIFNNHLFLSGNSRYKNRDFHTQPINTTHCKPTISNYTYFGELDYCAYGTDDTAVIGYDTYRDGDLIVFKEEKNNNATLYRRTRELTQATNYEGAEVSGQYEYIYPMYEINTFGGEGAISNDVIANFNGSTIYLTKNGLKVLSSKETTYNNARYSYDMSSNINYRFKNKYSKEDKLYTFKDKLFLITNNGVYMAFSGLANENELEWFPIDFGFIPEYMFEVDGEVYFTGYKETYDNSNYFVRLYRLNNEERYYQDRKLYKYNVVQYDNENSEFYFSNIHPDVVEGQKVLLYNSDGTYLYRKLSTTNYTESEGKISETTYKIVDGSMVEAKIPSLESMGSIDYYIRLDESYQVIISSATNREVNSTSYKGVKLADHYGEITPSVLWNYDFTHLSGNDTTQLTIIKEEPVVAYYLTKPFNFGTSMYEKTIWGFTVINDTGLGSDTGLSYVSNREERDIQSQISSNGIDLNEYNYDHFSFANDNLPHMYTRYKVISRVSFIRFAFKNNESTNMVLTELTLLYSVSRLTRGIK